MYCIWYGMLVMIDQFVEKEIPVFSRYIPSELQF